MEGLTLMNFELSITIQSTPEEVFAFLRDKDQHEQEPGSPVLILEKTTSGPAGIGARYREVVQMLPFIRGEIISEITRFDPPNWLEEDFSGAGMSGHLSYHFVTAGDGTRLTQRQRINFHGPLRLLHLLIRVVLLHRLTERLNDIKAELEKRQ
jgi:hypothetical protein